MRIVRYSRTLWLIIKREVSLHAGVIHDRLKGQGIATELAKALVEYGFKKINLNLIFAVTDKANTLSQKVLMKTGFVQGEDIIRNERCLSYFQIARDVQV